ncbi:MAG: ABC transporter ATP-binding protein [Lachnospiraceae bacterium]|nr:ABC transporter ATP-binding protein [Lachnospiraceae bacterium]
MIEIRHLTKKYGSHIAVNNLNLTLEKGKIYGFLGPNGAGKSTTMNMITGYLAPSDGEVIVNGHDISKEPEEAKKSIGYLPELPPVYPDMTVGEYLKFVAELKGIKKAERAEAIQNAMELVKIKDMEKRLIRNLSKGYKQRVGLAQAIINMPEAIILDEPTVGLDPKQIIEIRDLIKGLGKNHTIILSSHILSEISAVCDYIFVISKGNLVASDSTENLEHQSGSSRIIEVTVKAEEKKALEVVKAVKGVDSVRVLEGKETGTCCLQVTAKKKKDVREGLFYALAEAKMPIYQMSTAGNSLEDIFLSLTGEQNNLETEKKKLLKNIQELDEKTEAENKTEEGSEE